ncbi:hypothetical protein IWQ61_005727 [Dispira simplex]|nr:hypothetical protein IWQ61_005727 [Dispira simplex]
MGWQRSPPLKRWWTRLLFLLVIVNISWSLSVFEDEAGISDWQKKLIGIPHKAVTYRSGDSARIVVATEKNVIASLHTHSDEILWRHALEEDDQIIQLHIVGDQLVTLSGLQSLRLRIWDLSSAFLMREHVVMQGSLEQIQATSIVVTEPAGNASVVVLANGQLLTCYVPSTGEVVWSAVLQQTGITYHSLVGSNPNALFMLGHALQETGVTQIQVSRVEFSTGTVEPLYRTAPHTSPDSLAIVSPEGPTSWLAWNSKEGLTVNEIGNVERIYTYESPQLGLPTPQALATVTVRTLPKSSSRSVLPVLQLITNDLTKATHHLYRIEAQPGDLAPLIVSLSFPQASTEENKSMTVLDTQLDTLLTMSTSPDTGATSLWILVPSDTASIIHIPITLSATNTHGSVTAAWILTGADLASTRVLAVFASGQTALLSSGGTQWTRPEYLAHTVETRWVELPDRNQWSSDQDELAEAPLISEDLNPVARYLRRWRLHLGQLGRLVTYPVTLMATLLSSSPEESALSSVVQSGDYDAFGVRKLVVFLSSTGMVTAVDTLWGHLAWVRFLPTQNAALTGARFTHLFVTREAVARPPPVLTVIGRTDTHTFTAYMSGLTGDQYTSSVIPEAVQLFPGTKSQVYQFPFDEPQDHMHPLVFFRRGNDHEPLVHVAVVPDTTEVRQALHVRQSNLFFAVRFKDANSGESAAMPSPTVWSGYQLTMTEPSQPELKVAQAWQFQLTPDERIILVQRKTDYEAVASLGRVLGNRSVLYKYLNPHLMVIAAVRPQGSHTVLSVYFIDTVSGALVHRAEHQDVLYDARHPVHAILCENWVVYQYWWDGATATTTGKGQTSAYITVTVELFESDKPNAKTHGTVFSSFQNAGPHVVSCSFVLSEQVTALGVTTTRNGVATRELVMSLASGRIVTLPRSLVDPRRPQSDPNDEEKQEGLTRYEPLLPNNPKWTLSYHHQILGIQRITSSPAKLESTSLVLAYGLDIFFTRVNPSGTFDRLSDSFSKPMLLATIITLVAGLLIASPMVKRKSLLSAWS